MSFRPLGEDLKRVLDGWLENPESRRVILQCTWQRAVGDAVAKHCRAVGFEDGVLTVEVTDSSWAPQLEDMTAQLTGKINAALGKSWVRRIDWV